MVVGQLKGNGTGLLDHHVKKGNMVVLITGFHLLGGGDRGEASHPKNLAYNPLYHYTIRKNII